VIAYSTRARPARGQAFALIASMTILASFASTGAAFAHSAAREWNELLLESIRKDFARPTVHARNLYHVSLTMWDSWAVYDSVAQPILTLEDHATADPNVDQLRSETLSYACYRLLRHRFAASPGKNHVYPLYDQLMATLGYDPAITTEIGNSPAAIGNRIAANVIAYGLADNSNEINSYKNQFYAPINAPLVPTTPGNPNMTAPNRWQPLALSSFIDQAGQVIPGGFPEFLSPEWGRVKPFALSLNDVTVYPRDGFDYWVYHDPGAPPYLGTATGDQFKKTFAMVATWSSHLDPADGVMIDISPGAIGNAPLPTNPAELAQFYDYLEGGDWGVGHPVNPVTGQPYPPQIVPRGDYARVLAEFWADGPNSETPPGHWFSILNYVSDHPSFVKRLEGQGPILNDLEWDVKSYLALGGAMHDCAVSAWGVKGWYDYPRPVSAIRYLASLGQSSNPVLPNYHPDGIELVPGYIELVTPATTAPGQKHFHLFGHEGEIAIKAWRGPAYITIPATDHAGVGWILAAGWWPYQRPTFVTPPFAGYVSGHSTYSRAAATVMHQLTGSPYFPGGLGEFHCPQNEYLVFEEGPSVDLTLQWASYYDASDQCSLSRIWGGIHPPADDLPGRFIGAKIGPQAFERAKQYWNGAACPVTEGVSFYGHGCAGTGGIVPKITLGGCPTPGGDVTLKIGNAAPQTLAVVFVGTTTAAIPLDGDCLLHVSPIALALAVPLGGTAGLPGSGGLEVATALPASAPLGATITLQALIVDSANPFGYAATNGLAMTIE
jgi:hypothetical protein